MIKKPLFAPSVAWNLDSLGDWIRKLYPDLTAVKLADLPLPADAAFFHTESRLLDNYLRLVDCIIGLSIDDCRGRGSRRGQCGAEDEASHDTNRNPDTIIVMTTAVRMPIIVRSPVISIIIAATTSVVTTTGKRAGRSCYAQHKD